MFRVAGGGSTVGQMQRIYGWRVNERRKVRKGWQQVSPFVQGQQLGEGLSDRQVWRLEKELPQCSDRFLLPLQLRELYLIANGQCCEQQTGIMNGHRWMPLQEIVELWKERNWSSVEQDAVPKRAAEGAGCREGRQGCVYDRFAYGFGVELITRCWRADYSSMAQERLVEQARCLEQETGGWLVPFTSLAGFGGTGEWYGALWPEGHVYKVSGFTQTYVSDLDQFLHSLAR